MSLLPKDLTDKIRKTVDPEALLRKIGYRTETIQVSGPNVKSFCPIHKDQIFRTLVLDRDHWNYRCTNKQCAGAAGGDLIDFYAKCKGFTYEEAMMDLARAFDIALDPKVIEDYIKQSREIADNYREMGVFAEAEPQYERIVNFYPNDLPALRGLLAVQQALGKAGKQTQTMVRLAKVLFETGEYEEAASLLAEYVRYNSEDDATRQLYIDCLTKLGRKDEVARELVHRAESKTAIGDIDEALKLYRTVEAMHVDSLDVSSEIIRILISAGRQDEAVAELLQRSKVLLRMGVPQGAIRALKTALDIDPSHDDLRVRIAEIIAHEKLIGEPLDDMFLMIRQMLKTQAHGPAAQSLDRLEDAFPEHPKLWELKGDLEEARGHDEAALEIRLRGVDRYEKRKEYQGALDLLDKALQSQSDQVALLSRRAGILAELGRHEEAASSYLDVIQAFEIAKDFEQAAVAYQAVIDLQPTEIIHRQRQFDLYLKSGREAMILAKVGELAKAYMDRNEPGKAASCVERVFGIIEESADLITLHAEALESLGRLGEAAEQFLAAAKLLIAQKQYDQARAKLDRSLKCLPEHMESRELRADVLNEQKLTAQAISEYQQLAQFYLRAGEPKNLIRVAAKVLTLEPEQLDTLQLLAAAHGMLGNKDQQRATQMRLVWLFRQKQSYTPATEICEKILTEDESYTPAIEQMLAIAESTRKSDDALKQLWRLAQVHGNAGRKQEEQHALDAIIQRDPLHEKANARRLELIAQWGEPDELAAAVFQAIQRYNAASKQDEILRVLDGLRGGPAAKPELMAGLVHIHRLRGDAAGVKDALRSQAQLLARALRDEEAIKIWGELATLLPEDISIRRSRIELMLRSGKSLDAAEEYRFLGKFYAEHNQIEAAESSVLEALKIIPDDLPLREKYIELLVQQGKTDDASAAIETLAGQAIAKGNYDLAVATYERLLKVHPQPEDIYRKIIAVKQRAGDVIGALQYYDRLLNQFIEEGRSGAFEQTVHEALQLDAQNWAIRTRLSDHLLKAGRISEAEGILRDTAILQIKANHLDAAEKTVDQILGLNKESVQGRALRAQLLARKGNKDIALDEFLELAGALSEMRGSVMGQPSSPFAFGNYEGLTRVKEYTFDQFVVGSRNNFAYATAQAVSRAPGKNYNPLFLYADVGLGKTHLCHAIANYVLDHHPNMKVLYTMTEDFVGALVDSISNNMVTHFRNRYRQCDVLIIDDIQFLSGKERAQEEFFHIFNALFEGGKQIVITSDRPPKEITHLEKRLRSRFGAGIIVDIQTPDLETRIAIIRKELILRGKNQGVSDEAVLSLAECIPSNIRDLKGALTQVLARHEVSKEPIGNDLIHAVVDRMLDRVGNEKS